MRVAVDISRNVRGRTAKRILPERSRSNGVTPNTERGYRVGSDGREMTVRTAGCSRVEAVGLQRHRAVMLAGTAATCGNGLLRLHEGQSKSCKLQEKHQTGKQPSHEQEDSTTSHGCHRGEGATSMLHGHDRRCRCTALTIADCVRLKLSVGDRPSRHYNGRSSTAKQS